MMNREQRDQQRRDDIAAHAARVVAEAPPLSQEQREAIARIFANARPHFEISTPKRIEIKP